MGGGGRRDCRGSAAIGHHQKPATWADGKGGKRGAWEGETRHGLARRSSPAWARQPGRAGGTGAADGRSANDRVRRRVRERVQRAPPRRVGRWKRKGRSVGSFPQAARRARRGAHGLLGVSSGLCPNCRANHARAAGHPLKFPDASGTSGRAPDDRAWRRPKGLRGRRLPRTASRGRTVG